MVKFKGVHKFIIPVISILLVIGVALTAIGFSMERSFDYLREDNGHKWYQVIYIDDEGWLRAGLNIEGDFGLISLGNTPLKDVD